MFPQLLTGSLVVLCLLTSYAQANLEATIDALFTQWDTPESPGCALGVFKDGEIIYQRGYGSANLDYQIPNTPNTVFRVGSVSKQFTAACILLLVQQGKLSLDDRLRDFFPSFRAYADEVQIRHLLYHTSGIRDYDQLVQYCPDCDFDSYFIEDVLTLLLDQLALNSPAGTEYIYSNSGYWLLGQIVEKVSTQSLADFAQEHLFAPLGMKQTFFADDYTSIIPQRANGYDEDEGQFWWYNTTTSLVGDGGLYTSIADLKRWDDAFYDRSLLNDGFWKLALETGQLKDGTPLTYAAGIEIQDYDGHQMHYHNGNEYGFCAVFQRLPEQQLTVVILSNYGSAYSITDIAEEIIDLLLADVTAEPISGVPAISGHSIPDNWSIPSPEEQAQYCDYYWNPKRFLARQVYQRNDSLFYGPNVNAGYFLEAIGPNFFTANNGLTFSFIPVQNGAFTMRIFRYDVPISDYHPYVPVTISDVQGADFTGTYHGPEVRADYEMRSTDNQLIWYSEGEQVAVLKPVMNDWFCSEGGTQFQFLRDEQRKIIGFLLSNQRLRGIRFERI